MAFFLFFSLFLFSLLSFSCSQTFIGVNYGQLADNLPPPMETAKLLQTTSIQKLRLYGADPAIIKALAGTGIGIVIGTANGDVSSLASDPNSASQWINSNVLPFYPASKIILITVGNEVLMSDDPNLVRQLLPAMQNVQKALEAASLGGKIKVSTVHPMSVLGQSEPPSGGSFAPAYQTTLKGILQFLNDTASPFAINPYPFFAYQSDPRPETLSFCLFQPNPGRVDSKTGIKYMNMFDAQVDAVYSAMSSMGFKDVEIMVAETGWPSRGDSNEVGPGIDNAKAYNGNLIKHLRSMVGTPLMPGKSVDTYIFAIYDENLKPGPGSERAFGLFKTDLSMVYDVGLANTSSSSGNSRGNSSGSSQAQAPQPSKPPASPSPKPGASGSGWWCVAKAGAQDDQLQSSLDYACKQGIDCGPIQQGGACFEPNTVTSHASYAMNLYFQKSDKNPRNCNFSNTATLTSQNPSYNNCIFPGGGETTKVNVHSNQTKVKNGIDEGRWSSSSSSYVLSLSLFMIIFISLIIN